MATNENAINLIVTQEAINQLNVAIAQVDALDKLILKTATDSATISAKLNSIKSPSGLSGNSNDNAQLTAQLQAQAKQIDALEKAIVKLNEAKKQLNKTTLTEQVNQRVLLANATLEVKAVSTMVGAYANLDAEHKKALKSAQNMGAQYGITSEQFKKASATANELDIRLKEIDANLGRHQRNVGNYASGFNALGNSINQLSREAPAFANSMNTGFMAISNNIPALTDAIKGIREENVRLRAEGMPTVSVFKQLAGAIFSWQTAISVGVTLLTVYGGAIVDWVSKLASGTKGINAMAEAQTRLNNAQDEGLKNSTEELTHLEILRKKAEDTASSMTERNEAVKELQDLYPSYLGNLTKEQILAGETGDAYKKLAKDILTASESRAIESEMVKLATEQLRIDKELRQGESKLSQAFNTNFKEQILDAVNGGFGGRASAKGKADFEKKKNAELKAITDEREILMKKLLALDSGAISQTTGKDIKVDDKKEKTPKKLEGVADTTFALEKQRLERVIETNNAIVEDQKETEAERMQALSVSHNAQMELIEKTKKEQLKQAEITFNQELKEGNKTKEGLIQLRVNYEAEKKVITNEASNDAVDVNKKTEDSITKIFEQAFEKRLKLIHTNAEKEKQAEEKKMADLKRAYVNGEISYEDYLKQIANMKSESDAKVLTSTIDALSEELTKYSDNAEQKKKVEKELHDLKLKLLDLQAKKQEETDKAYIQKRNEIVEASSDMLGKALGGDAKLLDNFFKKLVDGAEISASDVMEVVEFALQSFGSISAQISEARIQDYENQIDASNEYYDNLINQETTGDKKRKELEAEKQKREAELQKKIAKEKEKQAKLDKAIAIAQIGIQTALSVVKASPVVPLMILAGISGAIALATAIATPIPKYKDGRFGGKSEFAIVGDGGRSEVVTDGHGNNPIVTPNKPTLTHLKRGDIVHKSLDDFSAFKLAQMKEYALFGDKDNKDLLNEMQLTRKAIENQKLNVNVHNKPIDLDYALWKNAQIHW